VLNWEKFSVRVLFSGKGVLVVETLGVEVEAVGYMEDWVEGGIRFWG